MFKISGVVIHRADVLAVAVTVPLVIALAWFISRTRMGARCGPPPRTPRPRG